ncbi:MAG: hypothetical protein LLG06_09290 [Desulfobacteraceae bacterium]|nr:hypothetical protein [Desulfobacteraceae bacterium]
MEEKRKRIAHAKKTYCEGADQAGVEVCSWENMPGWDSFMKGEIDEAQLSEQAREDLAELNQTFGKYLKSDKEENVSETIDGSDLARERAKTASKIYRQACVDSGKNLCFFKNFLTWQEFVHGGMEEREFYQRAMEEIHKLGEKPPGN